MSTLLHNLKALQRVDPTLVQRLIAPMATEHVQDGPQGPVLVLHRQSHPLSVQPVLLPDLPETVRVFGVGLGEQTLAALDAGHQVVAWDRDPLMLRMLLSQRDLVDALQSGRLRLMLGADLAVNPQSAWELQHPLLTWRYAWEHRFQPADKRAMVVPDGLFVEDVAEELTARGYSVWPLPARELSELENSHALDAVQPELVVSVGYIPGLPEALGARGIRHLIWEVDPALDHIASAGPAPTTRVFTYRRAHVERFREAGLWAEHRALCANPRVRRPVPHSERDPGIGEVPVAFVGASMRETATRYRKILGALLHKTGRSPLELEHWLAEQRERPWTFTLARHLRDPALQALVPELDLQVLAGEIAAAQQRLDFLGALLPLGLKVWGDAGWKALGTAWQGLAGHRVALSQIYSAAQVNVDIGRVYQSDILTMRVFDVLACGGLLVTQDSPTLREHFTPGEHLLVASDPDEMAAQVAWALAHPTQARLIAQAGQAHVLAHHTTSMRLDEMLAPAIWETPWTPSSSAAPGALARP